MIRKITSILFRSSKNNRDRGQQAAGNAIRQRLEHTTVELHQESKPIENVKIIAAPNAFKGSMSGNEAAQAIRRGLQRISPDLQIECLPVADGGDGLVEVLAEALEGEIIQTSVCGPLNDPVEASFCLVSSGTTAVIEMAQASGLALLDEDSRNPDKTTTFGTGELIRNCLDKGVDRLVIGLGGSATCDGGIGAAAALGYKFLDDSGQQLTPIGENLIHIKSIDTTEVDRRIFNVVVEGVCDVANILTGPDGASFIYSPQKGADTDQVVQLDEGLRNLAAVIRNDLKIDIEFLPGAGAAGGLGGAVHAFMGGRLRKGIELVVDLIGLKEKIMDADLVITGEGRIDNQTIYDKAPAGVARVASENGVACVAIAGSIGENIGELHVIGIDAVFSLCRGPETLDKAMTHGAELLEDTAEQVGRFFLASRK